MFESADEYQNKSFLSRTKTRTKTRTKPRMEAARCLKSVKEKEIVGCSWVPMVVFLITAYLRISCFSSCDRTKMR